MTLNSQLVVYVRNEIWTHTARDNFAKGKSIITSNKQCDCTPVCSLVQIWRRSLWGNWAAIQLTRVRLILVVSALKPRESRLESGPAFEKSGQACIRLQKCEREKRNKGNQSREEDKQTTTTKNPSRKPNSRVVCAEARQEDSSRSTSRD